MNKTVIKRFWAIIVVAIIAFTQILGADLAVLADSSDINNPPTKYPSNCVKKIEGCDITLDTTIHSSGGYKTFTTFNKVNIAKYDGLDFDVFIGTEDVSETRVRFYVLDSDKDTSIEHRAYKDVNVKTNEWVHMSLAGFNNGYGMNANVTNTCAIMMEANDDTTHFYVRNLCLIADDIVSPDDLPSDVINTAFGSVNTTVTNNMVDDGLFFSFDPIDFSYGDNIELDYFVGSTFDTDDLTLVLLDKNEKRATYNIKATANSWQHLKVSNTAFNCSDGFDIKKVKFFKLENTQVGNRYYFDNLCTSGIAWPTQYPEGTMETLGGKSDFTGVGTGGLKTITSYGKKYDFTKYDFFEFDIYIKSSNAKENVYFFLFDDTYDINNATALPTASQRLQDNYTELKTNEWIHVRTTTANLGSKAGTGDKSKIAGFYLTSLKNANRYIVLNQCLTNLVIPQAEYSYMPVELISTNLDYRGTASTTDKTIFESTVDFTKGKYFEFDANVVSISDKVNSKLVVEDENGNTSEQALEFTANSWLHSTKKTADFVGSADLTKIKNIYISDLSNTSRTVLYNLAVTDIVAPELSNKYDLEDKTDVKWDWSVPSSTYSPLVFIFKDKSVVDLTKKEFIEFDVCFETDITDDINFRLWCIDVNGKRAFLDVKTQNYEKKNGWYHFMAIPTDFNSGYGQNGDITKASRFAFELSPESLKNNATIHVDNFCFTKFTRPELKTRFPLLFATETRGDYTDTKGANCLKTVSYFKKSDKDSGLFDITTASHIELDIFVESTFATNKIRCYVLDNTYSGANTGRGFRDITVTTNEWNHVLIEVGTITTGYGMNGDLTKIIGMMFEQQSDNNGEMFHICNVAITKKTEVPEDVGIKPAEPDKESRYISNAEDLMNSIGVWNTAGITVSTKYKTEGKTSVTLKLKKQDDNKNNMRFLFDGSADLSVAQSLRFDLFVDDLNLITQNTLKVGFTSNKRFNDKCFNYYIDVKSLKLGWNSFDIPLNSFNAELNANWGEIYGFFVGLQNTNLGNDDSMLLGLDNVRIYKTFVAGIDNQNEEDEDIDDNDDDYYFDDDYEDEFFDELDEGDSNASNATTKKIIRRRRVGADDQTSFIVLLVVCIVGGVLLITGIVLSVFTERKYRRILRTKN